MAAFAPLAAGWGVLVTVTACSGQDLEDDRKGPAVIVSPTPRDADQGAKGTIAGIPESDTRDKETNTTILVTPGAGQVGNGTVTSTQTSDGLGGPKIATSGTGPTSGTMNSATRSVVTGGGVDANVPLVARAETLPAAPQGGVESLRAKFCTVRLKAARLVGSAVRVSKVAPGTGFTITALPDSTALPEGTQFLVNDVFSFKKDGKDAFALMAYGYDSAGALVRFEVDLPDEGLESECKLTKGRYFSLTGQENVTLRQGAQGTVSKPLYLKSAFP